MRKFSLSLLSLSLLLFTCLATRSEYERFNQCQLNNINALEPDHRVEHEAGLTETWNPNHPELQCAGVSLIRRTIDPNGLHLPSYSPSPQLIFIIQGKGVLGLSVPGCPETFEQPRSSRSRQESRHQEQQQQPDSHQKIRRFYRGDVIAIPAGTPYWTYNHGQEPLVAISLLDTSNFVNQLDSTPRVFYLGGNPEVEFPETQERQQGRQQQRPSFPGRRGGRQQQEEGSEEQNEGSSVLSGFSSEFLAQALNTDQDTAKRLQSPRDQRSQIVRVEGGLSIISPEWQQEDEEYERSHEEEEDERRPRHIRRPGHQKPSEEEQWETRYPRHSQEERERDPRRPGHSQKEREWDPRRPGHGQEERERDPRHSGHSQNGLEETICSLRIVENIARPARADLYNPRAGRISDANSLTLPILRNLRLSAEYVLLYRNGIYAPHWNINANSLLYVIRGQGRVRIVNCQGNAVFDDNVRRGQLLVVPQNFVVAEQAGNEEALEYVVFKTNDLAAVNHVKQVFRATPREVLENAFGLRPRDVTQIKFSGNRGPLVHPQSQPQS
ncbi:putative 11-S seed storage protein, plant [Medicago truncatula]|uniref:Glycinin G4 n=1 Tax=Medicago truncatula TaxID=3880 RepID=G7IEH0_MEDTR|nr:legumin J [Medicago truncatula]AES60937.1 glycinin G4 [Medicago truncatula]RHN80212.1 putative 11-S seed storage protein, plant [Medicago truncatula]